MNQAPYTVYLVDDDSAVRDSLSLLLVAAGYEVACYSSAQEFLLQLPLATQPGCLLLDLRMPGMSGLELQSRLNQQGWTYPILFLTAHGDIPQCTQAFKGGALDFLSKPISAEELLMAVESSRQHQASNWTVVADDIRLGRLASLTGRERDVLRLMLAGHANRDVAEQLALTSRTVETHRLSLYRKLGVATLPELLTRYIPLQDQL